MSVSIGWRLVLCVCAFSVWPPNLAAAQTFKIASWNIRSGHGISGLTGPSAFDANTRCADRATPINAWGVGEDVPSIDQIVLSASLYRTVLPGSSRYDQTIVSR